VLWIGWLRGYIRNGAGEIADPILASAPTSISGRPGGYDAVLAQEETGATGSRQSHAARLAGG
jgi:hypothetical protein